MNKSIRKVKLISRNMLEIGLNSAINLFSFYFISFYLIRFSNFLIQAKNPQS